MEHSNLNDSDCYSTRTIQTFCLFVPSLMHTMHIMEYTLKVDIGREVGKIVEKIKELIETHDS